jgi:hypothetical protein
MKEHFVENMKETQPAGELPVNQNPAANEPKNLGDEIMNLLYERTPNPSEAFVMLQQMCIFLWEQYKIDWQDQPDFKVAESRKQRYLDFVSSLIDSLLANNKSK